MMKTSAMFFLTALWCASSAWADGVLKPAHGGRMVEVAGYRLELVSADGQVDLYVTDHGDRPLAVDKATGKVTMVAGGEKREIPLSFVGGNRLSGQGASADKSAAVITVEGLDKRLTARIGADKP